MTDPHLIAALRRELAFMKERGFGTTARNIEDLCRRFENLAECFRLLAEREERLTRRLVDLEP